MELPLSFLEQAETGHPKVSSLSDYIWLDHGKEQGFQTDTTQIYWDKKQLLHIYRVCEGQQLYCSVSSVFLPLVASWTVRNCTVLTRTHGKVSFSNCTDFAHTDCVLACYSSLPAPKTLLAPCLLDRSCKPPLPSAVLHKGERGFLFTWTGGQEPRPGSRQSSSLWFGWFPLAGRMGNKWWTGTGHPLSHSPTGVGLLYQETSRHTLCLPEVVFYS